MSVKTNGDMARALTAYSKALTECNDDKAALRRHLQP